MLGAIMLLLKDIPIMSLYNQKSFRQIGSFRQLEQVQLFVTLMRQELNPVAARLLVMPIHAPKHQTPMQREIPSLSINQKIVELSLSSPRICLSKHRLCI